MSQMSHWFFVICLLLGVRAKPLTLLKVVVVARARDVVVTMVFLASAVV